MATSPLWDEAEEEEEKDKEEKKPADLESQFQLLREPDDMGPLLQSEPSGSRTPPHGKRRTGRLLEDDDLLQNLPMSNDSKATAIANEIMFYLQNEIWAQAFPPRVNPDKLKEITREEIESRQSNSPEVESPQTQHESPAF